MTEPSQYFKGRTVQEQMNEVIGYVDTRAAEVATTAIASDVAQVHQDMLDADADAQAAAASAAAAAGTLANAVKKTGEASQSIAGDIAVAGTLSGGVVTGTQVTVPAPVNNTDAASKKYVDDADALKADKTYVDAQDATKISINNINNYAIGLTGNQNCTGIKEFAAIKTPYLELENNFRPVIYYSSYDGSDVQTAQRIRPITVFTSPNTIQNPIMKMETVDDQSITGFELTTTIYNTGVSRDISLRVRKSDGMGYVTAPSRGSSNVSDYNSNEVVTIDTLRKLGLIQ